MKYLLVFVSAIATAAAAADAPAPSIVPLEIFSVPEGLEVTLWARSPMLKNPTNIDIDAAGRIWVTEGVNYRRHKERDLNAAAHRDSDRKVHFVFHRGEYGAAVFGGVADHRHNYDADENFCHAEGLGCVFDGGNQDFADERHSGSRTCQDDKGFLERPGGVMFVSSAFYHLTHK